MCSVDNSESAFLSEDFPGSRWMYQRQAVTSLCAHYAIQSADSTDTAHITADHAQRSMGSMCVVAAGNAKLQHPPSPLRERESLMSSLLSMRMTEGPRSEFLSALRLAAVGVCCPTPDPQVSADMQHDACTTQMCVVIIIAAGYVF